MKPISPIKSLFTLFILLALLVSFFHAPTSVRAATLQKAPNNLGLVGYWAFDEGAGTTAGDSSGNGNTSVLSSTSWTDGKKGKALNFNGSNSYAKVDKSDSWQTQDLTISLWIKPSATQSSSYAGIIGCHGEGTPSQRGWVIQQDASTANKFYFAYGDGTNWQGSGSDLTTTLTANAWQNLVVTKSGTSLTMYVNGIQVDTFTSSNATILYGSGSARPDLYFGDWFGLSRRLNGLLDDIRLYSRALSATDVSNLYRSGQMTRKALSESGLVGYWPFNEGRGTTAGDASGNGRNGTLTKNSSGSSPPVWGAGKRGGGLYFSGGGVMEGPYVSASLPTMSAVSGFAWYKLDSDAGIYNTVFRLNNDDLGVLVNKGSTSERFHIDGWNRFAINSNIPAADDGWHHIGLTYDGTTLSAYFDGALVTSSSSSTPYTIAAGTLYIGTRSDVYAEHFKGYIDDVRIYNRALSAAEVAALYKQNETTVNANTNSRITDGLVGAWSFNGNNLNMASSTAEILDVSGNGNHGDNSGGVADAGKIGQGWYCTTDDQVTLPDIAAAGTTGSYSLWVKPDSNNVAQGWIDSNYDIFQWSGSALYFRAGNQSLVSIASWQPNEWHHVAMTWNGSNYFGYIDGVQVTSGTQTGSRSGNLYLCRVDGGYYYSGGIDEVRIYNRPLSAAEIKQLYNLGK